MRICAALVMLTIILCMSYPVTHSTVSTLAAGEIISSPKIRALEAQVSFTEVQVTTDPNNQIYPAVYGNLIVWIDDRNGNWDIYMYDISTSFESPVTTDPADQMNPDVYGNIIVWEDWRNGYPDIYMYDLTTGLETPVCTDSAYQMRPAIYGDIIVWQDQRNGDYDIYMYDLMTHTETRLTADPADQICPVVYGDIVVWQDWRNWISSYGDIYMYDLITHLETPVCTDSGTQDYPDIFGNIIVWMDYYDIYMYDISTNIVTQVTTDPSYQAGAVIYGNIIVWQDLRNGDYSNMNFDIYMYDVSTNIETQITTNPAMQAVPEIYGNLVVWTDFRNGIIDQLFSNGDIYMAEISLTPPPTPTEQTENVADIVAEIPGVVFAGATVSVQENRRHALLNMLQVVIAFIQTAEASSDPVVINAAYQSAIDQLNSILDKTDGCAERGTPDTIGSGYTPDWITSCESQALIDPLIRELIASLEALLVT